MMNSNSSHNPINGSYHQSSYHQVQRKSHTGFLVIIAVLIILMASIVTAFAFGSNLMNTFAKLTKSPAEYYIYVEKKAIFDEASGLLPLMNHKKTDTDSATAYHLTSDLTINYDTLDSLMQTALGVSLSEIEDEVGMPFESLGLDVVSKSNGTIASGTIGLKLNQVNLLTGELFNDYSSNQMLLRIPELSPAYLCFAGKSDLDRSNDTGLTDILTATSIVDLLKRYGNILASNVKQVEIVDNFNLLLDDVSQDCTKLTVTMTQADIDSIVLQLLAEAKEDPLIVSLLQFYGKSEEDYQNWIVKAEAQLQDKIDSATVGSYQMVVYVNRQGKIIGRDISSHASDSALGYTILSQGKQEKYLFYVKDNTGNTVFSIAGHHRKFKDAYHGKAVVTIKGSDDASSDVSLDINYEDLHSKYKDNHYYQYGNFTVSSLALMGIQITMNFDVEEEAQTSQLVFRMGAAPLILIDTRGEYVENYKAVVPSEDAQIYNISDMESYTSTIDTEVYINELSEKLGIDLQSLIDKHLSDYFD